MGCRGTKIRFLSLILELDVCVIQGLNYWESTVLSKSWFMENSI